MWLLMHGCDAATVAFSAYLLESPIRSPNLAAFICMVVAAEAVTACNFWIHRYCSLIWLLSRADQ